MKQLAREASEAGVAHAEACIRQYGVASWSDNNKILTPSTDCDGNVIPDLDDFVAKQGYFKSAYSISTVTGTPGNHKYNVSSKTDLLSSGGIVHRSLSGSIAYDSNNVATPTITGGAGWGGSTGHINIYKSIDGQIYGFGDNGDGQLSNSPSAIPVSKPVKIALPDGVNFVTEIQTSGQGASFLCIIGDDQQAYCRGSGASLGSAWTQVGFKDGSPGMKVYNLALNGYSWDYICVVAGASISDKQAYCAGNDWYGILGDGVSTEVAAPLTAMKKFVLPGTLKAKSIENKSFNICVIASDDSLYCSGESNKGQIAGTSSPRNDIPIKYQLPKRGSIDRKVKAVFIPPHSDSSANMVLATDGTLWASGDKSWGSFGTGEASGATGSGNARLWGSSDARWDGDNATGGSIKVAANQNPCLDNENSKKENNNKIQIYDCDPDTSAQKWFFLDNEDGTSSIWLPGRAGDPTDYCLAVNGVAVQLFSCANSDNQKWVIDYPNGVIKFSIDQTKCLDIVGGVISSERPIQIYSCNNSNAQKFIIDGRAKPWRSGIALNYTLCGLREDDGYGGIWCSGETATSGGGPIYYDYNYCLNSRNPKNIRSLAGVSPGVTVDLAKFSNEWKYQIDSLMFIATDGKVYGAGRNKFGKLGNNLSVSSANYYKQCTFNQFKLPTGVTASDMSARDEFSTFVLGANGRIYASGLNDVGQLGNESIVGTNNPVETKIPPGMGYSY